METVKPKRPVLGMSMQDRKYDAERLAFEAEARYTNLQAERLIRARYEEDVEPDRQRILDFVTDVNDASVFRALSKLTKWRMVSKDPITIRFNTPGGDFISAMALYDYILLLRNEGIEVRTVALGMAASAGAALMQAGTVRAITPGAWFMIHEVSSIVSGKLSEMIDETKWTERAQARYLDILSERANLTAAQIKRKIGKKDWWMTAQEAVDLGFADEIEEHA